MLQMVHTTLSVIIACTVSQRARAELGRTPRWRADAARCARTLTQTLGALKRLLDGAATEQRSFDDDLPQAPMAPVTDLRAASGHSSQAGKPTKAPTSPRSATRSGAAAVANNVKPWT